MNCKFNVFLVHQVIGFLGNLISIMFKLYFRNYKCNVMVGNCHIFLLIKRKQNPPGLILNRSKVYKAKTIEYIKQYKEKDNSTCTVINNKIRRDHYSDSNYDSLVQIPAKMNKLQLHNEKLHNSKLKKRKNKRK